MNRTASELPELHNVPSGAQLPMFAKRSPAFDTFEMFTGAQIAVPRQLGEHWALREWNREGLHLWVNLNATGATAMDPARYRHLTTHLSAINIVPVELFETLDALDALGKLLPGWNGYDVAAPKTSSILEAKKWIREMYEDVIRMRATWHKPHAAADADGDIMFEWWNNGRDLTIEISDGGAAFLMAWGTNMETDMEDGEAMTPAIRRKLWTWLTS
ncbi:MAG: hypothetical protein WKF95_09290 [Rubrobacter sp.]